MRNDQSDQSSQPAGRLLDDGEFYVRLDPASRRSDDIADVFLERRGLINSPERVGAVHLQSDQSWLAVVSANNPKSSHQFAVVAQSGKREEAIVALWQHRRDAFLGRHAL